MKDTLNDIAFRITAYRHGSLNDAEYQASVLSILEEWERGVVLKGERRRIIEQLREEVRKEWEQKKQI